MLSSTDPITPVHNHGWCDALALSSETPGERVTREIADNLQRAGIVLEMYHAEAAPGQVSHLVPVIDCPDVDFAVHIFSMSSLQDHSHRCKQPMRWYPLVRSLWGPRIVMACGQLCLLGFLLIVVSIFLQAKRLNTRKFKLTHSTRWKCSACSHLNKANSRKQEGVRTKHVANVSEPEYAGSLFLGVFAIHSGSHANSGSAFLSKSADFSSGMG